MKNSYEKILHDTYIESEDQHLIYNDGMMISWWEEVGDCIEIHHSNLDDDNYVFVTVKDLRKILNKLGYYVEC